MKLRTSGGAGALNAGPTAQPASSSAAAEVASKGGPVVTAQPPGLKKRIGFSRGDGDESAGPGSCTTRATAPWPPSRALGREDQCWGGARLRQLKLAAVTARPTTISRKRADSTRLAGRFRIGAVGVKKAPATTMA